ncbi:MAG TPA: NPCBM/NEW2 domain-containing protein [Armatimonadota bacterium]|jgi:alpha-galactosidase
MPSRSLVLALALAALPVARAQEPVRLESLDLSKMTCGWERPKAGKSVAGNPLTMQGVVYANGVGTHSPSRFHVKLDGQAARFHAVVGVDDENKQGSVIFDVKKDNHSVVRTRIMRFNDPPRVLDVDLTGARTLDLIVEDAGDGNDSDHADWADASITPVAGASVAFAAVTPPAPKPVKPPTLAYGDGPAPAIHGPRITGATPGRPFLFLIPATGKGPLSFSAKGLPAGLKLDARKGIITGSLQAAGRTTVLLTVKGPRGAATRALTIVGGEHKLALTPPMGWNSWNVWAVKIDDAKVRAAADAMVSSGLAAHGFQYINIDDCWEAGRDAEGNILTNSKFPNMKALSNYVHSKGLKLGIYSSPGPTTCGGYTASWQHEQQDAKTWADWGIDYIKYDWCSYSQIDNGSTMEGLQKPYRVLREALDNVDRDIVYSFCQYGMGKVWEWGAELGGNLWRTTGDINDSWGSLNDIGFHADDRWKYAGPGHWNDVDMLILGKVGWGYELRDTRLTPYEQLTHMSLWALHAAPLLIGCDMTQLNKYTLSLLTNDEVLDVNQDVMGRAGNQRSKKDDLEVWARPLSDGTLCVGLFNRGPEPAKVTAHWSDLGLKGRQSVRDLWLRKDIGAFKDAFTAPVAAHGAVLVKIGKPKGK